MRDVNHYAFHALSGERVLDVDHSFSRHSTFLVVLVRPTRGDVEVAVSGEQMIERLHSRNDPWWTDSAIALSQQHKARECRHPYARQPRPCLYDSAQSMKRSQE